jgi:peptidoglycan hydrolase CwlO-like protein
MTAKHALAELSSHWQPLEECFEVLFTELKSMEQLASSLSSELEVLQQELLRRAHQVETLQAELKAQRHENQKLVARCENQDQHLHEELAALKQFMQTLLQRPEPEKEEPKTSKPREVVKYPKRDGGFASSG